MLTGPRLPGCDGDHIKRQPPSQTAKSGYGQDRSLPRQTDSRVGVFLQAFLGADRQARADPSTEYEHETCGDQKFAVAGY